MSIARIGKTERLSRVVVHGQVAYFSGLTADDRPSAGVRPRPEKRPCPTGKAQNHKITLHLYRSENRTARFIGSEPQGSRISNCIKAAI